RRTAEEAIQLHGGMGVTDELRVSRHLKRQLALDATFGSPETHLRRHAALRAVSPRLAAPLHATETLR
ncbi:MAG: acyl-CoA dehydrogenase family protein, partial [Burkholderiales bacterium]